MKNKAKCKLCKSTIESFTIGDYVTCSCGEIAISGGTIRYECYAKDFGNFLRVDDLGNEITIKIQEKEDPTENVAEKKDIPQENVKKPNKEDLLKVLDEMIKNIENLPPNAMTLPINHYDFCSSLILIAEIFRSA